MKAIRHKLLSALGAFALTGGLMVLGTVTASAATNFTCVKGTVPSGTYRSLTIAGFCSLDGGTVIVEQNLVLQSGAGLNGLFAGSTLSVRQSVLVGSHAILLAGRSHPILRSNCKQDPAPCVKSPGANSRTVKR